MSDEIALNHILVLLAPQEGEVSFDSFLKTVMEYAPDKPEEVIKTAIADLQSLGWLANVTTEE